VQVFLYDACIARMRLNFAQFSHFFTIDDAPRKPNVARKAISAGRDRFLRRTPTGKNIRLAWRG